MTDTVYEFIFTDCIYESAMATISLHHTKRGAYRAMNKYLNDIFNKKREERISHGTNKMLNIIYDHVLDGCAYRVAPIAILE